MDKKLRSRILKSISKVAPKKAVSAIMKTVDKDLILPLLKLTSQSRITSRSDELYIYLYVGRRDFQFYPNGNLMGCGTILLGGVRDSA